MTITPRPRFSVRLGIAEAIEETPHLGVPAHLRAPLRQWVRRCFTSEIDSNAVLIGLHLRIVPPKQATPLAALISQDGWALLDVIDTVLGFSDEEDNWFGNEDWETLEDLLDAGGSAYRVNQGGDGLEERITPAVRDAVSQAVADAEAEPSAGSAAEHLASAWRAAYGLHPDPVRAYSEAIKAVECAAHSVVQPNHARATLGTMLGEFKGNARAKFTTALSTQSSNDAIAPAEAMMRVLWDGQTSRHGKQTPTVPETLEAARAGIHLAATLVQWFSSGVVIRTP
ncbi:hypothetical protein [Streptomyces sp. NBC_01669]|uniref:hypothetical protein n=1 Tax=Streptomyces sp. NBC_01669 TaxID=2975909 RepID=UPI00225C027D|nr:hypothetical protein [Streptomyces sp. NBC_01669]MCX4538335.1 hypothetical protein [Streptomyces sp. NBC_01669]